MVCHVEKTKQHAVTGNSEYIKTQAENLPLQRPFSFTTPRPFSTLEASTWAALARWASSTAVSKPNNLSTTWFQQKWWYQESNGSDSHRRRRKRAKAIKHVNHISGRKVQQCQCVIVYCLRNSSNCNFQSPPMNILQEELLIN